MIETALLENGIRVVMEPMEQVRSVALGVYVEVGSAYETPENNGISHMIEHMLFKGTEDYSAKELAIKTALLGDDLNAYTAKELTCYYGRVLDVDLNKLIEILGDMLTKSVFNEEDLEREKRVILDEIDMYDDSPEDLVSEHLQNIVWSGHPLGAIISGTKSNVRRINRAELVAFKESHYTAERMLISVAGHIMKEPLLEHLNRCFSMIPRGGKPEIPETPVYSPARKMFKKDTEQVHFCIGFPGISHSDPDNYTLSVMNNILGGSSCSRLFQRIREEEGLCYSVYSYASSYRDTGTFQIYSAMNAENVEAVYKEALGCIRDLKERGPDENEMLQTISQIRSELYLSMENTHNRMNHNARNLLFLNRIQSVEEIMEGISGVKPREVCAYLDRYAREEDLAFTIAGNPEDMWELTDFFQEIGFGL